MFDDLEFVQKLTTVLTHITDNHNVDSISIYVADDYARCTFTNGKEHIDLVKADSNEAWTVEQWESKSV